MKVFITSKISSVAKALLVKEGITVKEYPKNKTISRDELINSTKNADGIISLLTEKFDKDLIDKLQNCKVIANYAVGYNNIDVDYAKSKGIVVTNTPDVLTDETAEIAVSLIIACSRQIVESDNFMREKKFVGWEPKLFQGIQRTNKTLRIVGTGRIGQATATRMK
ncbi:MAG: D-glycerate dehydrogenase, partial [Ignavibacteriae bacterium]|nr:D-glycerate dehydrogenase [Ignavibacteriota bacterium]